MKRLKDGNSSLKTPKNKKKRRHWQKHTPFFFSFLFLFSDNLHPFCKHLRESERIKETSKIERYKRKAWKQCYIFVNDYKIVFRYKPVVVLTDRDKILFMLIRINRQIKKY